MSPSCIQYLCKELPHWKLLSKSCSWQAQTSFSCYCTLVSGIWCRKQFLQHVEGFVIIKNLKDPNTGEVNHNSTQSSGRQRHSIGEQPHLHHICHNEAAYPMETKHSNNGPALHPQLPQVPVTQSTVEEQKKFCTSCILITSADECFERIKVWLIKMVILRVVPFPLFWFLLDPVIALLPHGEQGVPKAILFEYGNPSMT